MSRGKGASNYEAIEAASSPLSAVEVLPFPHPPSLVSSLVPPISALPRQLTPLCCPPIHRRAFVTLLTRSTYLPGVQGLARSLAGVKSAYPLIVLHTTDTLEPGSIRVLQQLERNVIMKPVQRYHPPSSISTDQYKTSFYSECFTKLTMWTMEDQYDRLVYLDADMLVLKNIDFLFSLPLDTGSNKSENAGGGDGDSTALLWAVGDCTAGKRTTPEERDSCPFFSHPQNPSYFNAGLFVMTPCRSQFHEFGRILSLCAQQQQEQKIIQGYAEQDLLKYCFKSSWKPLPPSFNHQKGIKQHHPHLWSPHTAFVLHFTDHKPWNDRLDHPENREYAEIVDLLWKEYSQQQEKEVTDTALQS